MALRIRKGDKVVVLSGRDKGKSGEVLGVFPREDKALVQGVNMVTRASKADARGSGGITRKESKIHLSNIALEDPGGKGGTRFSVRLEEGRKRRHAKRSKEYIDA